MVSKCSEYAEFCGKNFYKGTFSAASAQLRPYTRCSLLLASNTILGSKLTKGDSLNSDLSNSIVHRCVGARIARPTTTKNWWL